jgi:hypothetical protein
VHFFEPGVKLFSDAVVRNTILVAEAAPPPAGSDTSREWHDGPPPAVVRRQKLPQADYAAEVFRPALPALRLPAAAVAHAVKHVCYVSVGMVLNSDEKKRDAEKFKLDDLLVDRPDATHPRAYVGSEDLRLPNSLVEDFPFAAMHIRYLEYGTERVPALVRRPTFPELYNRDKIMVAKFGGAVHDDGSLDATGYLTSNHTVFLFVPWRGLAEVRNRSVLDRVQEVKRTRADLESISDAFTQPFLAGLFNSSPWAAIIAGRTTEAVAGGTQPNDYADQPIPVPDPALAAAVGHAATAARDQGRALSALLSAGWQRQPSGWRSPPTIAAGVAQQSFGIARTRWGLTIERPTARCGALWREGDVLLTGKTVAARLPSSTDPAAADFLVRMLNAQGGHTLQAVEAGTAPIPLRPQDAAATERALLAAERAALAKEHVILDRRAEIDGLVAPLFEAVPHPPIETVTPST